MVSGTKSPHIHSELCLDVKRVCCKFREEISVFRFLDLGIVIIDLYFQKSKLKLEYLFSMALKVQRFIPTLKSYKKSIQKYKTT